MRVKGYQRKLDIENGGVDLSHGSRGRAMARHQAFGNEWLARCNDQSAFELRQAGW
ncbi:hydrogenase expression/formation protein HypE [Bradyrhizobium sp. Ghvi]|nr:hydrogenase expression/formation protein HypE [Bradyrhizobium sp. Ghvi]